MPSPPHASGGFYNPPAPAPGPIPGQSTGFTQHPNVATTNLAQPYYPPTYDAPPPPQNFTAYHPPPSPGPAPGAAAEYPPPQNFTAYHPPPTPVAEFPAQPTYVPDPPPAAAGYPTPPPGTIPPPHPNDPSHVSSETSSVVVVGGRSAPDPKVAAGRTKSDPTKGASGPSNPCPCPSVVDD